MATAMTTSETSSERGAVYGASLLPRETFDKYPVGTRVWQVTTDYNDLQKPDSVFVVGSDWRECLEALERKFPAPHPWLSHVEVVKKQSGYKYVKGIYTDVRHAPDTFLVHWKPLLIQEKTGQPESRYYNRIDWTGELDELATVVANHGPVLIHTEQANGLTHHRDWDDNDLVIGDTHVGASATTYRLLKYNPSSAKGRRTRATNQGAKQKHDTELGQAAARMREAIDRLAVAIRDDLDDVIAWGLMEKEECHEADDHEPRVSRRGKSGYYGVYTGRNYNHYGTPTHRYGVLRLRAFCLIHEKFKGKKAYRRLPLWQEMRQCFKGLPEGLKSERWGLTIDGPCMGFWLGEMLAKPPRPRPIPPDAEASDESCDGVDL